MKSLFHSVVVCALFFISSLLEAGVLKPAQEVELLESVRTLQREVKELKAQVQKCQSSSSTTASSGGLKTEDYGNQAATGRTTSSSTSSWGKDKINQVMSQISKLKEQMATHQKMISDLEKEIP